MANIVKYDCKFNLTSLNDLKVQEQDVFFTLCSEFTAQKTEEVKMSFFDLRQKIGSKTRKADMEGFFSSTSEKILQTIFSVWDDEEQILRKMPLFSEFVVNFRKEEISLRLNNCFRAYLYQIPERVQFNRYELSAFLQMRSKYSKTLFRYLLQNFTGRWNVGYKDFRELMGIPNSQSSTQFARTMKKAFAEIEATGYITNIQMKTAKARRIGTPIERVTLTYEIHNPLDEEGNWKAKPRFETQTHYKLVTVTNPETGLPMPSEVVHESKTVAICKCCGHEMMEAVCTQGENKGRRYKFCSHSKYAHQGYTDCTNGPQGAGSFEWLDDIPVEEPESQEKELEKRGQAKLFSSDPAPADSDGEPAGPSENFLKLVNSIGN